MRTLSEIKDIIRSNFDFLKNEYSVLTIEIFGSYTRKEQSMESDIDLLVTFSKAPSLLKYIALENHISELLGVQVDLVMKKSIKPHLKDFILREVQPI